MGRVVSLLRSQRNDYDRHNEHASTVRLDEAEALALSESSTPEIKAMALKVVLEYISSDVLPSHKLLRELPELVLHKDTGVHTAARDLFIATASEQINMSLDFVPAWRNSIEKVIALDSRSNEFIRKFSTAKRVCECLSAVAKWTIQDDKYSIVRFFLFVELESQIFTGKSDLSEIATDFLDFCGVTYFRDFYPLASDYLVSLLAGECFPQRGSPSAKVFYRLCKLKRHDLICQLLIDAVRTSDLGKIDYFSLHLFPDLFANYHPYEVKLIEVIDAPSSTQEMRENALYALFRMSDGHLKKSPYYGHILSSVRYAFTKEELRNMVSSETHPTLAKNLLQNLMLVRD